MKILAIIFMVHTDNSISLANRYVPGNDIRYSEPIMIKAASSLNITWIDAVASGKLRLHVFYANQQSAGINGIKGVIHSREYRIRKGWTSWNVVADGFRADTTITAISRKKGFVDLFAINAYGKVVILPYGIITAFLSRRFNFTKQNLSWSGKGVQGKPV